MSLSADQVSEFKDLLKSIVKGQKNLPNEPAPTWDPKKFVRPPEDPSTPFVVLHRKGGSFRANRAGDIHDAPAMIGGTMGGSLYLGLNFIPEKLWDAKEFGPKTALGELEAGLAIVYRSHELVKIQISRSEAESYASTVMALASDGSTTGKDFAFQLAQFLAEPYASQFAQLASALDEAHPAKIRSAYEGLGLRLATS